MSVILFCSMLFYLSMVQNDYNIQGRIQDM